MGNINRCIWRKKKKLYTMIAIIKTEKKDAL